MFGGIDDMLSCRNIFQFTVDTWLVSPSVMQDIYNLIVAGQSEKKIRKPAG